MGQGSPEEVSSTASVLLEGAGFWREDVQASGVNPCPIRIAPAPIERGYQVAMNPR